ncbi:hypothetical protein [Paenibacillus sp. PL91]|uniref:hypothetical protein n=1 Tax=Paenibacillus sp. PL91 TaxID=2729538 RepID=UPI001659C900|nr:hypothetical protein [Paenibacillus sp. PL91]MBC9205087.1 hypothetical protein [Paenibacillus sp. PL91]
MSLLIHLDEALIFTTAFNFPNYTYKPKSHGIGTPFSLHFFGYAKVWVKQRYTPGDFGFEEPVTLTIKLKKGQWYATNVHTEP